MNQEPKPTYWEAIALNWKNVGSPLRPCRIDIENFSELIKRFGGPGTRALILGVTPELYGLPWPANSAVFSADRSIEMIKAIWPGPEEQATQANWLELPFPDNSFDCALCDGGLHLLQYPDEQKQLSASIARILKPGGRFIIRLFARPVPAEHTEAVFSDLQAGNIPNTHIFKLRLLMAMQDSPEEGILLKKVFEQIVREFGSLAGLQAATGWPAAEVSTLASYETSTNRYGFLTEEQSIEILHATGNLSLSRRIESRYPLGERCPVLSFKKS